MALTMTRTRTQTTLTKLAEMVANVHGELAFLEGLLEEDGLALELQARLNARKLKLVADRDALYATIRQFDARIELKQIGASEDWRRQYGSSRLSHKVLVRRYVAAGARKPVC